MSDKKIILKVDKINGNKIEKIDINPAGGDLVIPNKVDIEQYSKNITKMQRPREWPKPPEETDD